MRNFPDTSATRCWLGPDRKAGQLSGTGHRLLALSATCGVLQGAVNFPWRIFQPGKSGKMDKQAEVLVETRQTLLRFADEYSRRMVGGVDNFGHGTDALSPAEVRQLTQLLVTLDPTMGSSNLLQLSAQMGRVQQAKTGGKEIVDYAFRQGTLLVVIALVVALIYRFLVAQ